MLRRLLVAVLAAAPLALLVGAPPAHAAATWGWPLPGAPAVDRPFQPPASAWGAGHRGVDLRGELGEPVLAAGSGTVTYAGLLAGRGVVTVTHSGGLRTTYEPVDASVGVGQHVTTGDRIGTLSTGHASCRVGVACLHWGLLRGRTYLDPLGLVVSGHLRLLPYAGDGHRTDDRKRPSKEKQLGKDAEKKAEQKVEQTLEKEAARAAEKTALRTAAKVALRNGLRYAGELGAEAAGIAVAPELLVAVGVVAVGYGVYRVAKDFHVPPPWHWHW